ncbi:MAG: spore photoproduct lyase family protein [Acidobacteriota bacterium]
MIRFVYVESEVLDHPRVTSILSRLPKAEVIEIDRFQEVFNRRAQSFRLQKSQPTLILARKHEGFVLPTPEGYGIGGARNFYFSHMMNCLYDCRYCFLQGMYRSAHLVVFVNFEDYIDEIEATAAQSTTEPSWFFSGYDCDSLAFDGVTAFADAFLPALERIPRAHLELRTKSVQVGGLLRRDPHGRCVVAYSLSPESTAVELEHGAPSLARRLEALSRVQEHGWPIGLRFDPLVFTPDALDRYRGLFEQVADAIDVERVHSVSLGLFRLPQSFYRQLVRQYPEEELLARPMQTENGMTSYRDDLANELRDGCESQLLEVFSKDVYFPCLSS